MNIIDILLLFVIGLSVYNGYYKGFILGTLQLILLATGMVAAFLMYPYLAGFLTNHWPGLGIWTVPLSFIASLIIARIILSIIANKLLETIPEDVHVNSANRLGGLLPGAINGAIWAILLSALLLSVPISDKLADTVRDSQIASKMADQVDWLDEKLSPVFDEAVNKTINRLMVEPGSEKTVSLPFKEDSPTIREDLESRMLELVNKEREKEGLSPLKADPELQQVARAHSRDMFAKGYFSHVNLNGKDPFDRMRKAGVRFRTAGENLALGQTLSICHRGLMNSPGHRANILKQSFGRVGIGILDGGIYGLMVTQNFRN